MLADLDGDAKKTETPAPAAAEPAAEAPAETPAAETPAAETPAAEPAAEAPAAAEVAEAPAPAAAPAAEEPAAEPNEVDQLLIEVDTTEKLRREAMNIQAMREIAEASEAMTSGEYKEAVRHYNIAYKLLNDSPKSRDLKRECAIQIAEGLYRAALEEERTGRRERAIKYIEKAVELRHPKARRQLEAWLTADDPSKNQTDVSEISHRRNDDDYKQRRERERKLLKRSRQLLAQREIDRALEQCELVLAADPYNQEALRLRDSIQRKRSVILQQERKVAREGWIADVDEAWRPVYAVDAREVDDKQNGKTIKTDPGADGARTVEQTIVKRMKEMRLPAISFKPPATIIDAVEYFRGASKDFDRPEIPLEQRGFNFVLKTPEAVRMQQASAGSESDDFSDTGDNDAQSNGPVGVPVIPMITESDISFYDALKLVCESVEYKFSVQGPIVMVMHKDMSTEELVSRSFPVLSSFIEKMSSASEEMTTMGGSAFGNNNARGKANEEGGEEDEQEKWKRVFNMVGGVDWPEGSTIYHMKTIGRLFVNNTQENLAKIENALDILGGPIKLVEIETRFVEVCQDDLNSLGFEWILNSDYSLDVGKHISRALGLKGGQWGTSSAATPTTTTTSGTVDPLTQQTLNNTGNPVISTTTASSSSTTTTTSDNNSGLGRNWTRSDTRTRRTVGVNGFGGTSDFSNGNRYLSTMGNHINGEAASVNDQFMKVNAFLGSADLSMILHMLSQRSDTDLLSAPKVLTRPGEEAVMKVVTEYIYPTDYDVQLQSSSSSSGGYGGSNGGQSAILAVVEPQSFTMREVGVILQVTPTLTDDGNVVDLELNTQVVDEPTWKNYGMKIPFTGNTSSAVPTLDWLTILPKALSAVEEAVAQLVVSDPKAVAIPYTEAGIESMNPGTITYYEAPMEQPFFHVRSVDSKVSVYPGATIVMGGLITEARKAMDDKIPFLGDIPFIGRLFRSHAEQTSKRNLLIFVTTRIVDGRGREMHNDGFEMEQPEVKSAPDAPEN